LRRSVIRYFLLLGGVSAKGFLFTRRLLVLLVMLRKFLSGTILRYPATLCLMPLVPRSSVGFGRLPRFCFRPPRPHCYVTYYACYRVCFPRMHSGHYHAGCVFSFLCTSTEIAFLSSKHCRSCLGVFMETPILSLDNSFPR